MRSVQLRTYWSADSARCALVSVVVLAALLLPLATGALHPDAGAEVRSTGGQWIVVEVDPDGLAALAGLRVGDTVVALDGQPPRAPRRTDPGLALGGARTWTVWRQGALLTVHPSSSDLPWASLAEPILLLAIAATTWGVGLFVRLSRPENDLARGFFWLSLAMALALGLNTPAGDDVLWAKILEVLAFALLPALFLGFFLRFALAAPPTGHLARVVSVLFLGGLAAGVLYLAAGLADSAWYDAIRLVLLALLAVGFLGALVALLHGYRRPASRDARRQIRVVLIGTGLAVLPLTALCLIPETVGLAAIVRPQFAAFGLVSLPITFAYAILRYRLLGIDVIARRALVYGTMTLLLAGGYGLLIVGLDRVAGGPVASENPALSLIFFAAMTVTFIPVRDRVCWLVDHLIYRDRYDYVRTLQALGVQIASARPIEETLAAVVDSLRGAMNLRGAAVLLRGPDGELTIRAASGDLPEHAPSRCPDGAPDRPGDGLWIPLGALADERGFLYLGPKRSGAELADQDRELAATIAGQLAIAVANALLVERLRAKVSELELLRDRLLHVQDAERKRLAQELHDGPLHTVLDLVRQADIAADLAEAAGAPVERHLRDLVERGRDAAYELRTVCADLYPSELTHLGLVAALESLVQRINRDENLTVVLHAETFPDELRLPGALEDALYRTAREALDNVCRHAAANRAWIDLGIEAGQVTLEVRDDGHGFHVPSPPAALARHGHLGLVGMRERIEGLGGAFAVTSAPGAGTTVSARVSLPGGEPDRPNSAREVAS